MLAQRARLRTKLRYSASKDSLPSQHANFRCMLSRLKPPNFLTEIPEGQDGDNVVNTFLHTVTLSSSDLLGRDIK